MTKAGQCRFDGVVNHVVNLVVLGAIFIVDFFF